MRAYFACLRHDILMGGRFIAAAAVSTAVIALMECLEAGESAVSISGQTVYPIDHTGIPCLLFEGIPPVSQDQPFILPLGWLSLMLALCMSSCLYPAFDKGTACSLQVLARSSRSAWWWAKITWSVLSWGISLAVAVTLAFLVELGMTNVGESSFGFCDTSSVSLLAEALCASLCVSLLASVISLCLGAVAATCLSALFLVLSSYFTHPILFANYAMTKRTLVGAVPSVPFHEFLIVSLCFCLVVAAAGYFLYSRSDLLR